MPRRGTFFRYVFVPLAVNLALAVGIIVSNENWYGLKGIVRDLECLTGRREPLVQGLEQGFVSHPGVEQRLATPCPARDEATDIPGWRVYTVPEGQTVVDLVFTVQTDRDAVLFFPRANGRNSSVEVAVLAGGKAEPLTVLRGPDEAWTPVSARYAVSLRCLERGRPLVLRVRLTGPWAQLWHKDGQVFFELPGDRR